MALTLDCTLRDGGYYNNWDFNSDLVNTYLKCINELPVDYIEVGYRNPETVEGYYGKYFFLNKNTLKFIKEKAPNKKIAIMVDTKFIKNPESIYDLIYAVEGFVDMVRLTIDLNKIDKLEFFIYYLSKLDVEIAINFMYITSIEINSEHIRILRNVERNVDYFYLVDSYGNATPNELENVIKTFQRHFDADLGFHGHNNLELALANAILSERNDVKIIDTSVLGMGRGPGNLKLETWLIFLFSRKNIQFDIEILHSLVSNFHELQKTYNWGTNMAYMLSGAINLPQKYVMESLSRKSHTLREIVTSLYYNETYASSSRKLKPAEFDGYDKAVIIGGGKQALENQKDIQSLIDQWSTKKVIIIFTTIKTLDLLEGKRQSKVLCISGNQIKQFSKSENLKDIGFEEIIVPPDDRHITAPIPENMVELVSSFDSINYPDKFEDSPLLLSLEFIFRNCQLREVDIFGFDGYSKNSSLFSLNLANQSIFDYYKSLGMKFNSYTKTNYQNLNQMCLFSKSLNL